MAERVGVVQPGEETAPGRPYCGRSVLKGAYRKEGEGLLHFLPFSLTPTFGVLLAIDLHLSPFSHTWWGEEYFPTLSQWHRNWSWQFQGARKPSKDQPKGWREFFVAC